MGRAVSKAIGERQQRVARILPILKGLYPDARCSLDHSTPLELLIATILSAQCTDDRVNIVTRDLFRKYRSAGDLAAVAQEILERDIQSTGFFRNKAKSLRGMAAAILAGHGGKVPDSMDELTKLPGVGRKTANVVLGNAFGLNVGIVVDTHVSRLSQRLGLTKQADPVRIEADLMAVVPKEDWTLFAHLLIFHGRKICQARKPKCDQCPLLALCPYGQKLVAKAAKPANRGK